MFRLTAAAVVAPLVPAVAAATVEPTTLELIPTSDGGTIAFFLTMNGQWKAVSSTGQVYDLVPVN